MHTSQYNRHVGKVKLHIRRHEPKYYFLWTDGPTAKKGGLGRKNVNELGLLNIEKHDLNEIQEYRTIWTVL